MRHLKVTFYSPNDDADIVAIGTVSFDGEKLRASKALRYTVEEPIRVGSETIDPAKEPERFLRSLHLVYRSAYFSASKAE